ncbi:PfkB family carbohydrate kinase, partial [Carnobacterium sp.]
MDIVVTSSRFPKIGETILGESLAYYLGGKGANQAVAASRMGIKTCLLG